MERFSFCRSAESCTAISVKRPMIIRLELTILPLDTSQIYGYQGD
jgi:hypothetical protein